MQKREAEFTIKFRHWLKANPMQSAAFELKQSLTNSIAFSVMQKHQLEALKAVNTGTLIYKLPDDSLSQKPFDIMYYRHAHAYVVIKYPKCFCIIPIDNYIFEQQRSKRKSLTAERAREISTVTIDN